MAREESVRTKIAVAAEVVATETEKIVMSLSISS